MLVYKKRKKINKYILNRVIKSTKKFLTQLKKEILCNENIFQLKKIQLIQYTFISMCVCVCVCVCVFVFAKTTVGFEKYSKFNSMKQ